jgi:mono/diheme cytochrome c family protein
VTPPSGASARGPRRRRSQLAGRLLCLAFIGAALLLAGCAGRAVDSESADVNQGKTLFVKNCGSCHTLQDAATAGTVGPNLDDAFLAARSKEGGSFDESTFFQITLDQMRLAAPPMPNFDEGPQKLPEQQLEDIAAYVAKVAGKPPAETGATGETGATSTTP